MNLFGSHLTGCGNRLVNAAVWIAAVTCGAVVPCAAQQSLFVASTPGTISIPNTAPFNALGSTRVEMRVHNITNVSGVVQYIFNIYNHAPMGFALYQQRLCVVEWADSNTGGYTCASAPLAGLDAIIRFQRDVVNGVWLTDIVNYQTGASLLSNTTTMPVPRGVISVSDGQIGNNQSGSTVNCQIAWIKWFSTLVPLGSPVSNQNTPADLADWRFEGSLANQGTSSAGVTMSFGAASYGATPVYAPACNAGLPQSFRAGFPATLNGSGSISGDDSGVLQFLWQQVPSSIAGISMQRLHWSSHSIANPTITGLVFGPANFQLTVTQGDGQKTTCTVNHGAVATDDNGVVMVESGNPQLDNAVSTLLGPMIQFGKNPWPFYDTAAQMGAAFWIANMDTSYPAYWTTPSQGSVAITPGSATVVGNGTNFLSTFCNADGSPRTDSTSQALLVWYPTNNPNFPGQTGRRSLAPGAPPFVVSCKDGNGNPSDTQLTLASYVVPDTSVPWCPSGQSAPCWLQYSSATPSGASDIWNYAAAPADYYDEAAAYYALYYRSGQDLYLANARKIADRFWTSPQMDRGNAYQSSGRTWGGWPGPFRCLSLLGMVLRALDTGDGDQGMWAGLHNMWTWMISGAGAGKINLYPFLGYYPSTSVQTLSVEREWAYGLSMLSYCALFDTDPSWQLTCRDAIKNTFATSGPGYLNIWPQAQDPTTGGWDQYGGLNSTASWNGGASGLGLVSGTSHTATSSNFSTLSAGQPLFIENQWVTITALADSTHATMSASPGNGANISWTSYTTVNLKNGSTAVSCNGNCGWSTSVSPSPFSGNGGVGGGPVWFLNSPMAPLNNSQGDADVYCYQVGQPSVSCTFVDSNHFNLDRPYHEPGCDNGCIKGWQFPGLAGTVGWFQEPFMAGLLTFGFEIAGRAMACAANNNPTGCDDPTSALAYQSATAEANWTMTYGYRPATYGFYYLATGPVCPAPISEGNAWCTSNSSAIQSRELSGDGFAGLMRYFQRTSDPNMKKMLDNIYAGLWAKPGVGAPPVSSPDGQYDNGFDTGGYWLTVGWTQHKLFDQMFGFSRQDNWPAARSGGAQATVLDAKPEIAQ